MCFLIGVDRRSSAASVASDLLEQVKRPERRAQARTMALEENPRAQTQSSLTGAVLAGGLGVLVLALAETGMSAVSACGALPRTREIGTRMAVGAQPSLVVRPLLGPNLRAVVASLLAGLAMPAALERCGSPDSLRRQSLRRARSCSSPWPL